MGHVGKRVCVGKLILPVRLVHGHVLEEELDVLEVVDVCCEPVLGGEHVGAEEGEERPAHVEQPVEERLAELLPPPLGVEEVEEHDARDGARRVLERGLEAEDRLARLLRVGAGIF